MILLSTLLVLSLYGCGKGGTAPAPTPVPTPAPEPKPTPETSWNKDRTFEVLVLSNSTSSSLASTAKEYEALANKVKELPQESYSMIIAEQANMVDGANPALAFPLPLKQFGYFNLHAYNNGVADAGLVVSKTWLSETNQIQLHGSAYLLYFDVTLLGTSPKHLPFPLHICTFRISSANEAAGFAAQLGKLTDIRKPHHFFGSVAKSQLEDFKKTCATVKGYELTEVDQVSINGYIYVYFAEKSFKLREVTERFKSGNVSGKSLAIETGVQ